MLFDSAIPSAPIGHNNPPGPIDFALNAQKALSEWLSETPIIQDEDTARAGARLVKQVKGAIDDMEAERTSRVRPLNDEVAEINAGYKAVREPLAKILDELKKRFTAFAQAEEDRRLREAEAARLAAEEAKQKAIEAERLEAEAKENAEVGEIGVDVGAAIVQADQAFADMQKANRAAARAERDMPVRLGTGFGRALSMRTKETLVLESAAHAIKAIGVTDKIRDAILSAARDYRKLKGKLPAGVSSITERAL